MAAKGKRSGASPRDNHNKTPAWAFLVVGLVAGFFLGTLVPLSKVEPDSQAKPVATKAKPKQAPAAESNTRFDFYTLLPEREVIVPAEETTASEKPASGTVAPKPTTSDQRYILQAGSFRRAQDADRRRAQVILLGLDARIESVDANGDRWHRVLVGPLTGRSNLDRARAKLIGENIDTLVLRQKSG